jgi:hypothetical protein
VERRVHECGSVVACFGQPRHFAGLHLELPHSTANTANAMITTSKQQSLVGGRPPTTTVIRLQLVDRTIVRVFMPHERAYYQSVKFDILTLFSLHPTPPSISRPRVTLNPLCQPRDPATPRHSLVSCLQVAPPGRAGTSAPLPILKSPFVLSSHSATPRTRPFQERDLVGLFDSGRGESLPLGERSQRWEC